MALLLTVSAFCGYYLSAVFGSSTVYTLLLLFGGGGLAVLSLLPFWEEPDLTVPVWLQRPEHFLLATTVFYLVAKVCSLLLHEWSHALWANCLGVRTGSIFDIHYGHGWIMKGIYAVDDGGFYDHLFSSGQGIKAAFVGGGGPLTNLILAVVCLWLLKTMDMRRHTLWAYFLFWNAVHNLAQLWSYIPARTMFHDDSDIVFFCKGLHIPQWIFLIAGTALLGLAFYLLLAKLLVRLAGALVFPPQRAIGVLALGWATIFMYYGALPIIYSLSSVTDPSMLLLGLELAVGVVVGAFAFKRLRRSVKNTRLF